MTSENRVPWLDFCRALAICLVLFGHGKYLLLPYLPWIKYLPVGGFLGVELFFVLSGFLIGAILIRENGNSISYFGWIPAFLGRRWLRTLPNYYFFLALNMVLLIYGIRPESADSYVPYLFFIQNLAWTHPPFFGEAWSLAVEEVFYLLVPIALSTISFISRSKKIGLILTTGIFFTTSLVARLIYVGIYNPTFDDGVRKIVVLRLDALIIGVFLAWIASSVKNKTISNFGIFLLPLFFVQPIFYLINENSFDYSHFARTWLFSITSLGCAGVIMVGIYTIQPPKFIIGLNSRIARLSYSVYLANLPVLVVVEYIFKDGQVAGYLKFIIYIFSTFFLSAITYRIIEVPFLYYRDRVISRGGLKIGDLGVSPK